MRTSRVLAVLCCVSLGSSTVLPVLAQGEAPPAPASPQAQGGEKEQPPPKIPDDQLDSLVSPIALYPDPLLAQVLAASTYPLEIVELQQWLNDHKDLKDQALVDAVQKQDWDPSVQALAPLPDAVKLLSNDIKWTTDLGNAFLAQESDVMAAVQRMRKKAQEKGNLKSNEQMKVETKKVEDQTVIVIEQADPKVVYVPTYTPVVVYGPAPYPYPPPPPPPPPGAVAATAMISFGVGVAMGAAFSGGWGYNCGWGHSTTVVVNNHNTFVRNTAVRTGRPPPGGAWAHNPAHRGGAPYANRAMADRYGGNARGRDAGRGRDSGRNERRDPGRNGDIGGNRGNAGGGNRVGDRNVGPSGNDRGRGGEAFGGGSRGSYDGGNARSSSARGRSSVGGGGGSRGGGSRGGRGGGGRGGGGRGGRR
jgi:hypothetical protein